MLEINGDVPKELPEQELEAGKRVRKSTKPKSETEKGAGVKKSAAKDTEQAGPKAESDGIAAEGTAQDPSAGSAALKDDAQSTDNNPSENSVQNAENDENAGKIAQLEAEIKSWEDSFDSLFVVIGRSYYERPEGYGQLMEDTVHQLDELKHKIYVNEKNILRLKGFRLCPNCESIVSDNAVFCGECGTRVEAMPEPDENNVVCSLCGAKNEKGKKFCAVCGQKLDLDVPKHPEDTADGQQEVPTERHCPKCGTKLPPDAIFCGECGTRL